MDIVRTHSLCVICNLLILRAGAIVFRKRGNRGRLPCGSQLPAGGPVIHTEIHGKPVRRRLAFCRSADGPAPLIGILLNMHSFACIVCQAPVRLPPAFRHVARVVGHLAVEVPDAVLCQAAGRAALRHCRRTEACEAGRGGGSCVYCCRGDKGILHRFYAAGGTVI